MVKRYPVTDPKAQRWGRGIALLSFLPRNSKGVGGQHHAPSAWPPGKTRYQLYKRLGGHQGRSGRVRKISPPPGFFFLYLFVSCASLFWYWTFNGRFIVSYCMLWIFSTGKIRRLRSGTNPRSWVPEASMQTTRPPKSLFDPRTVQPVASRYTDWAIPAPTFTERFKFNKHKRLFTSRSRHSYKLLRISLILDETFVFSLSYNVACPRY
jgi:hypothetical protein